MRVFVDANIFVALVNEKDSTHHKALKLMAKLAKHDPQLFTSSDIIKEAATIISQRIDHNSAIKFLNEIETGDIKMIFVDHQLHEEGLEEFKKQTSKNISCVDAISFVIMQKYDIPVVFTFDRDFRKKDTEILDAKSS